MDELFVKSLYDSIIKENLQLYKDLYETTKVTPDIDEYWKKSLDLYHGLSDEQKAVLMKVIEQTMIDTISNVLGVIDGSSTLENGPSEIKLLIDSKETDGDLQGNFLEFIEEIDTNK